MSENNNNFNYNGPTGQEYYTPPTTPNPYEPPMTVKDWVITLLILMIPCVGIIMMIVWAFSSTNQQRSNFCKAYLIMTAILFVIGIIFSVLFGAVLGTLFASMPYYY